MTVRESFYAIPANGLRTLGKTGLTLFLGTLGGYLFFLTSLPAGWMSGAMVFVSLAALWRLPVALPLPMRDGMFIVLGLSMGAGVTPDAFERVGHWPVTMAGLLGAVGFVTLATALFLRRAAGWNAEASYFGAIPGALTYVLALASEREVDLPRIAAVHTIRLLVLVCALPWVVTSATGHQPHGFERALLSSPAELALLLVLCLGASLLAVKLKVPGGALTGAFVMSAGLNATGMMTVALPEPVLIACYVVLGCYIGASFASISVRDFLRLILIGGGAVAVGLAVSVAFSAVFAIWLDIPLGQLVLAYAPGGLEVMTLLAFILDLDPAFVAAHQLVRFIGMVILLPFVTRLILGKA